MDFVLFLLKCHKCDLIETSNSQHNETTIFIEFTLFFLLSLLIAYQVSLGTIHKSKGLEWDFVFVLRCSDGGSGGLPSLMPDDDLAATNVNRFPSKSTSEKHSHNGRLQPQPLVRSEEGKLEEERRLLHVALTRARVCE